MSFLGVSKILIKNLITGPVTETYPFTPKNNPAGARGCVNIEIEKCILCSICSKKCPTFALTVSKEKRTWQIDRLSCVSCNYCVEVCPKKCLSLDTKYPAAMVTRTTETFTVPTPPAAVPKAAPDA